MSSSASTYISTPVNVPMADAWGYLNLNTAASPAITDHANVSAISRLGTGRYGITFAASNRFSSNAYVVVTTPEYNDDTTYGPVSCRIGNISGSTALGRSAGFEVNTFAYNQGFHSGGGTANVRDPSVLKLGFAAFSFSQSNTAYVISNTPENKFPYPTDIFEFYKDTPTGVNCTLSKDNIPSPVGNTPLKMVITGTGQDPQTPKWGGIETVICPASNGQIWRFQVFVRSSAPTTVNGQVYLAGANETGANSVNSTFLSLSGTQFLITTEWREVTGTLTINNSTVQYLQFRLDGPDNSSAGTTIWWDGLRIYQQNSDYQTVPGAAGYGLTGATYSSHLANMVSKRSATAYGTIVIPQAQGNSTPVSAYIENSYNVLGVSAGGNAIFDVSFLKPLKDTNYCVVLSGEYESEQGSVVTTMPSTNEFSDLLVRAGASNRFKTVNGFRVESRKQVAADNSWALQSVAYQGGRTERIHFMVFGGGTYGQP